MTVAACPVTDADGRVTDAVVPTTLEGDAVVVVVTGLLFATVLCVACTTFCGDNADDTSCAAVLAFTGDAPANWTTVGVARVAPCCNCIPVATC